MEKIQHNPEQIPAPVGGYSQGVEVRSGGRILFISGQIPETQSGEVPADFAAQCDVIWKNIDAILTSSQMNVENIVKITTYLTHPDQTPINSKIRNAYLGNCRPALTVIVAQTLESKWLLEIDVIAMDK